MHSSTIFVSTLFAFANFAAALPKDGLNYELYTNSLGYTTSRFKPGMEPGSADYARRFGNITMDLSGDDSQLMKRAGGRLTEPFVGRQKIPFGCDMNIPGTVLDRLHNICQDMRCDAGIEETIETTYPENGRLEGATVTIKATGSYPSGYKHAFIWALQAEAIPEAVEVKRVESHFPGLGHTPARGAACEMSYSSNFFSVVMRNADDLSEVGRMDAEVSFKMNGEGSMCDLSSRPLERFLAQSMALQEVYSVLYKLYRVLPEDERVRDRIYGG